jgi:hypothetical protein
VLRDPTGSISSVTPGTNQISTLPDGTKVARFTVTGTINF